MSLDQEEAEESAEDEGLWSEVDEDQPAVESTRSRELPDDLDEPRVSPAAEGEAVQVVGKG